MQNNTLILLKTIRYLVSILYYSDTAKAPVLDIINRWIEYEKKYNSEILTKDGHRTKC